VNTAAATAARWRRFSGRIAVCIATSRATIVIRIGCKRSTATASSIRETTSATPGRTKMQSTVSEFVHPQGSQQQTYRLSTSSSTWNLSAYASFWTATIPQQRLTYFSPKDCFDLSPPGARRDCRVRKVTFCSKIIIACLLCYCDDVSLRRCDVMSLAWLSRRISLTRRVFRSIQCQQGTEDCHEELSRSAKYVVNRGIAGVAPRERALEVTFCDHGSCLKLLAASN
jgi:hypothetical protein